MTAGHMRCFKGMARSFRKQGLPVGPGVDDADHLAKGIIRREDHQMRAEAVDLDRGPGLAVHLTDVRKITQKVKQVCHASGIDPRLLQRPSFSRVIPDL